MHGNFYCFKFHDVTLTEILGLVFTFALNYYQAASFFIPGGHFSWKKAMIFGWLAIAAMLYATFNAGTRKSLSEFWSPLLEQPITFVLSSDMHDMQAFSLTVKPDRIFGMDFDFNI